MMMIMALVTSELPIEAGWISVPGDGMFCPTLILDFFVFMLNPLRSSWVVGKINDKEMWLFRLHFIMTCTLRSRLQDVGRATRRLLLLHCYAFVSRGDNRNQWEFSVLPDGFGRCGIPGASDSGEWVHSRDELCVPSVRVSLRLVYIRRCRGLHKRASAKLSNRCQYIPVTLWKLIHLGGFIPTKVFLIEQSRFLGHWTPPPNKVYIEVTLKRYERFYGEGERW